MTIWGHIPGHFISKMPVPYCIVEDRLEIRKSGQGTVASEGMDGQEVDGGGKQDHNPALSPRRE